MDPGFTRVAHDGLGAVSVVPESSLQTWHAAGWRLLTDEERAALDAPPPEAEASESEGAGDTGADEEMT